MCTAVVFGALVFVGLPEALAQEWALAKYGTRGNAAPKTIPAKRMFFRCCKTGTRDLLVYHVAKSGKVPQNNKRLTFHDCGEPPKQHKFKVSELIRTSTPCEGTDAGGGESIIVARYLLSKQKVPFLEFHLVDGTTVKAPIPKSRMKWWVAPKAGSDVVIFAHKNTFARDKAFVEAFKDAAKYASGQKDDLTAGAKAITIQPDRIL